MRFILGARRTFILSHRYVSVAEIDERRQTDGRVRTVRAFTVVEDGSIRHFLLKHKT